MYYYHQRKTMERRREVEAVMDWIFAEPPQQRGMGWWREQLLEPIHWYRSAEYSAE
jgi:hypothetical protein